MPRTWPLPPVAGPLHPHLLLAWLLPISSESPGTCQGSPRLCLFLKHTAGFIASLPAPARAPGGHLFQHVCPREIGEQRQRGSITPMASGMWVAGGVLGISHAQPQPLPSAGLGLDHLARLGLNFPDLGQRSPPQDLTWSGYHYCPAPQTSLPINKRSPFSMLCAQSHGSALCAHTLPWRWRFKALHFKASLLSCGLG